jgi:hypothetical protein
MPGDEARPGLAPGSPGVSGTLFAALYGELTPRPETGRDPYIRFHDRAQAMGWLDTLWGMNDAGREHPLAAPGSGLVAWFQVGVVGGPLPVQPFLRCAGDVAEQLGELDLRAVQVLLPAHCLPRTAQLSSLATAAWFDDVRSATPVYVTVDSGQNPVIPAVAPRIHRSLARQDVFRCESLAERTPLPPPMHDTFWSGPPRHRVTFRGTLCEWSPDAIGWLGGFLAELAAGEGAGVPLLLTVERA